MTLVLKRWFLRAPGEAANGRGKCCLTGRHAPEAAPIATFERSMLQYGGPADLAVKPGREPPFSPIKRNVGSAPAAKANRQDH
ncbi:MAG: hypothetical protein H5U01_10180 [Clostridia bacterium]|nr:hypothetical protein [Clostridia bacterium]